MSPMASNALTVPLWSVVASRVEDVTPATWLDDRISWPAIGSMMVSSWAVATSSLEAWAPPRVITTGTLSTWPLRSWSWVASLASPTTLPSAISTPHALVRALRFEAVSMPAIIGLPIEDSRSAMHMGSTKAIRRPPRSTNWSRAYRVCSDRFLGWMASTVFTSEGISVTLAPKSVTWKKLSSAWIAIHLGAPCWRCIIIIGLPPGIPKTGRELITPTLGLEGWLTSWMALVRSYSSCCSPRKVRKGMVFSSEPERMTSPQKYSSRFMGLAICPARPYLRAQSSSSESGFTLLTSRCTLPLPAASYSRIRSSARSAYCFCMAGMSAELRET